MADGHLHFGSSSWLWKNNPGNRIYQTLWPANPDLGSTVTIRQQWVDRIIQAFLSDESQAEQLISQDLKHPKLITVATYQALHSAMNQVVGQSQAKGYR